MGGGSSGYRAALVRRRLTPALISFDDEDELAEPPTTEPMFQRIQATLQEIHADHSVPKEVRRRVLEASVRAPRDWHQDAIREAYSSSDEEWKLTAVFCMGWIRGFDEQILEMLESRNPDIRYEAVRAAGTGAWTRLGRMSPRCSLRKRLRSLYCWPRLKPRSGSARAKLR